MLITVVTPTWNGIDYLAACIASVKRNRGADFTVDHVVVDGGSTDDTVALARAEGLRVIEGKDDGIFDAINKGSFDSRGELLGFLGADDVMLEGALDAVARTYRTSGRRWVVGGIRWIDDADRPLGDLAAPPGWMSARMQACLGWNPIMHMSTYLSRDLFEELGGFDIGFRDASDYDLFLRARSMAPYARIDRPLTCFRRTGENNSVVHADRSAAESARVLARFGPEKAWEQTLWQHALRGWFNLRNPEWMVRKLAAATRGRFDPRTPYYF